MSEDGVDPVCCRGISRNPNEEIVIVGGYGAMDEVPVRNINPAWSTPSRGFRRLPQRTLPSSATQGPRSGDERVLSRPGDLDNPAVGDDTMPSWGPVGFSPPGQRLSQVETEAVAVSDRDELLEALGREFGGDLGASDTPWFASGDEDED
mmetsp:Transcript_35220/g.77075  ORF Transcript_35220/g.77075 Transcript_35220/m.77075 type:complete len:150 (+) Transcript_35220:109-558(+)